MSAISVAPMMDWTDSHCRYFHRLISPNVTLYTEMVTTGALLFNKTPERFLRHHEMEHPVVLQLGGSEPDALAKSAKMGADAGYDAINLNCGCPSERVQSGAFGACLMKEPDLVANCVSAMKDTVDIPVTIKCRIGIDDSEDYDFLADFITKTSAAGCEEFIIHARKAWLKGLSPKENRDIPPLRYDIAQQIKDNFPNLSIHVNGGIKTIDETVERLSNFDGVMIGREAYQNPWFLNDVERQIGKTEHLRTQEQVVDAMIPYINEQYKLYETPMKSITRHMVGLFQGQAGARHWRQVLSTQAHKPESTTDILKVAMEKLLEA